MIICPGNGTFRSGQNEEGLSGLSQLFTGYTGTGIYTSLTSGQHDAEPKGGEKQWVIALKRSKIFALHR